jgi:hypothetical protein
VARRLLLRTAALAVLLAACGGTAPPTTLPPVAPVAVDWSALEDVDLGNGWALDACGGPLACVTRNGTWLGNLDWFSAQVSDFDFLAGVADPAEAARLVAADYLDSFAADRAVGCPGWEFRPAEPRPAAVGGTGGLTYGFSLWKEGREAERTIVHSVVLDGRVQVLTITGADPEAACLGYEGAALPLADLDAFSPLLERIAAGSRFS